LLSDLCLLNSYRAVDPVCMYDSIAALAPLTLPFADMPMVMMGI
jgi:hypothetical protein